MTQQELSDAVMTLSLEDKKKFIITTLPNLAKDAMEDPGFLLELLPIMLGIVKDSGLDLAQLMPLLGGMSQKTASGSGESGAVR
ncbi:MAG: hypothetical protein K0A93_09380 [Desulfuromonadaceae bacterium]|nr:hypothetical protein [Desulfuromonadaceae bacterium]